MLRYLDYNKIEQIEEMALCNLTRLQHLYLSNNRLRDVTIHNDAFASLKYLQHLDLSHNLCQYVPPAVMTAEGLPKIFSLDLSSNKLTYILKDTFTNLTTLRDLEMSSNNIISIENGAFPEDIQLLNLGNNFFRFLHDNPFTSLSSLRSLDLSRNEIKVIPDTAFHNCTRLDTLDLAGNKIGRIMRTHLKDCPLSGYGIYLENNDLAYIEDGSFAHLTSPWTIDLRNNKLTHLPMGGDFHGLTSSRIDFQNNRITSVPTGAFANIKTKYLYLQNNKISIIGPQAFTKVSASRDLDLSDNPIRYVGAGLFNGTAHGSLTLNNLFLTKLDSFTFVDLTIEEDLRLDNNLITEIGIDAFSNVDVVRNMYLNNNKLQLITGRMFGPTSRVGGMLHMNKNLISALPNDCFDGVTLSKLNLSDNRLTMYPGGALRTQNLTKVIISRNEIQQIPMGSFLPTHTAMKELDLSHNRLTVLPEGLLDNLVNLETLDLKNNLITSVEDGALDGLKNLKTIQLSSNKIPYFPKMPGISSVRRIDLAHNEIEAVGHLAFSLLDTESKYLRLDLSDNPLGCDCNMFYSIHALKAMAVEGGTCSSPLKTRGHTFKGSMRTDPRYYLNVPRWHFQCSAYNLSATAPGEYDLKVQWAAPPELHPPSHFAVNTALQVTSWDYILTCTSKTPATVLNATVVDITGGNVSTFDHMFSVTDGVKAGTDYVCTVSLKVKNYTSSASYPALVTTNTSKVSPNDTVGPKDYRLKVDYYDFSMTHPDFSGASTDVFSRPAYVASPYGAWLAASSKPKIHSFSQWFRQKPGTNFYFLRNMTLAYQTAITSPVTHKYYSSDFFPVDELGYGHEGQRDCRDTLHNFGFTSAIRAGFKYESGETVTVAGGDELWLYINGILAVEVITFDPQSSKIPCKKVGLTPAARPGGGTIVPQEGVIVNGQCAVSTPLPDESFRLELEIGETYHIDLFHVERKPCRSQLFIQTENITFVTDPEAEPPMDYNKNIKEDLHVKGIVETLALSDVFSVGPHYYLDVTRGNEARHFVLLDDTAANRDAAVAPPAPLWNYTDLPGINISFVECPDPPNIIPEPNVPGKQSFVINTQTVLFSLNTSVDYEVAQRYYVVMTVVDNGHNPPLIGTISIRVLIQDVNDNCPVLNETMFDFEPIPALQVDPIIHLKATDRDSGINKEIMYMASLHTIDPPLSRYNQSVDLYKVVYADNSSVVFNLVAIDKGTPHRGAVANVSILLSNTCLVNVFFEEIGLKTVVNISHGQVTFRIPKYWVQNYTCDRLAGMVTGHLLDKRITASSWEHGSYPGRGRLNETYDPQGRLAGGWVAGQQNKKQWFMVDLGVPYKFHKLMIQGREDEPQWVKIFTIDYSYDSMGFTQYRDRNGNREFPGNKDQNTIVTLVLNPVILARYLRINPRKWNGKISLRVEIVGCTQEEQKFYDVSCQRCTTSWHCTGDGARRPCGRCDPPQADNTCGRSPTEHSFGGADECSVCPAGWICHNGYATPCPRYHYAVCNDTYCPPACTQCQPGYACRGGQRYECRAGTVSGGRSDFCEMCPPGTYQNETRQEKCINCPKGFYSSTMKQWCSPCPEFHYTTGDGSGCNVCSGNCRCIQNPFPCYPGVRCLDLEVRPSGSTYICGPCPVGFEGNGVTCIDVNECTRHRPCWNNSCINTAPGYQCLECPRGYKGTYEDAEAFDTSRRVFKYRNLEHDSLTYQTCNDINECLINNGGCDPNAYCINTAGSYRCGHCKKGFMGDAIQGCYSDNFCISSRHNCHASATCYYVGPADFRCMCNDSSAGNGEHCGPDPDMDGHSATSLSCQERGCTEDNCPTVPNSGQEDTDGDMVGDLCDDDMDNDNIGNDQDNCPRLVNYDQRDTDADSVGDTCDNCVNDVNPDQMDTDNDGQGDVCDHDDDGDGILDAKDNCPLVHNPGQENVKDSDSIGDACDNCPTVDNDDQKDSNENGVGDACDDPDGTNKDSDGDSILDSMDNCELLPNAEQADTDGDGRGDLCDPDIDGDRFLNNDDNCPFIHNPGQEDSNGNGVGDACEKDTDGDGTPDNYDNCPKNKFINSTTFVPYVTIKLNPNLTKAKDPKWEITDNGMEVRQIEDTEMPALLIGPQAFGSLDYSGTWFIDTDKGENYTGFVFGYQNNRKFYVVMARHKNRNYNDGPGIKGIQLKVVNSKTGPGSMLAKALWDSHDTKNQVKILWQDPTMQGWEHRVAYRWHLTHRPSLGLIRLKVTQEADVIVDSGNVFDTSITGGRLGLFVFNQPATAWSWLQVRCADRVNHALRFNGSGDYVLVQTLQMLKLCNSFTIGVWINLNTNYSATKIPVMCTQDNLVCLSLDHGTVVGEIGGMNVSGSTVLPSGYWTHVMMRFEAETYTLTLFLNGTARGPEAQNTTIEPIPWTENSTCNDSVLFLGKQGNNFFQGLMDEVRLFSVWMPDAEINFHLQISSPVWPKHKLYLQSHFTMDETTDPRKLKDTGVLGIDGQIYGNPVYIESRHDQSRFEVTYPDN